MVWEKKNGRILRKSWGIKLAAGYDMGTRCSRIVQKQMLIFYVFVSKHFTAMMVLMDQVPGGLPPPGADVATPDE